MKSDETIKRSWTRRILVLGMTEGDKIHEHNMKGVYRKVYLRTWLVFEFKLNDCYKMRVINTWVVSMMRHEVGIVYWKKHELQERPEES